ncbi:hypothetical protein G6F57_023227 [Rhizopus arrhizus]|nr:hypothetical protein G6F57_023227 [Rhizopus arrhizus]
MNSRCAPDQRRTCRARKPVGLALPGPGAPPGNRGSDRSPGHVAERAQAGAESQRVHPDLIGQAAQGGTRRL